MDNYELLPKDKFKIGDIAVRLWKNYCRRAKPDDVNLLGVVRKISEKIEIIPFDGREIYAIDFKYSLPARGKIKVIEPWDGGVKCFVKGYKSKIKRQVYPQAGGKKI